ncbi:MAG: fructosamine kinase, partial [Bacteroidetes bacterium]
MSLPQDIRQACADRLRTPVRSVEWVGGGDIHQARRLLTDKGVF